MSHPKTWGATAVVAGNCGLGVWKDYQYSTTYGFGFNPSNGGGTGFNLASFRNRPRERAVYEYIKKTYPIVFQSPVRKNRRTGNQWFFIIFDTKKQ